MKLRDLLIQTGVETFDFELLMPDGDAIIEAHVDKQRRVIVLSDIKEDA